MPEPGQDRTREITTPEAEAIGKDALSYLIREINKGLERVEKEVRELRGQVERQTTDTQKVLTLAEWLRRVWKRVEKHGERLDELERAVWPARAPRRPSPEDSGAHVLDPVAFAQQLAELQNEKERRDRRESFRVKEGVRLRNQIIGGVVIAIIVAVLTWVAAHATIHAWSPPLDSSPRSSSPCKLA